MAEALHFEVARDDLRRSRFTEAPLPEIAPGGVLVRVDRFALTANNITYAVAGDLMSYWKFFPAQSGWGRIPVWGFGDVARSENPALREGERLYGYFPMSTHLALEPDAITPGGFTDASPHRAALPAVYNQYRRVAADPGYEPALEDRQALLQPLFMTGFLLADFLEDERFFGARRVLMASASSKTAASLAFVLARSRACEVVGLTSGRNAPFVEKLGCYDRVVPYEAIASLPAEDPAVLVDMAGDGQVSHAVHHHFGDRLKHSCVVGMTHWENRGAAGELPGPKPAFFFAPTRIEKRTRDWGGRVLQEKMAEAWRAFATSSERWLEVDSGRGRAAVERVYRDTLEGRARPDRGYVLGLRD
jgi:NADPH:quinone reductase-like Zn-dependent oxidoreductase